jgi:hypothetical protein
LPDFADYSNNLDVVWCAAVRKTALCGLEDVPAIGKSALSRFVTIFRVEALAYM